jgi:hypothetical protein
MAHSLIKWLRHIPIQCLDSGAAQTLQQKVALEADDSLRLPDFRKLRQARRLKRDRVRADDHYLVTARP